MGIDINILVLAIGVIVFVVISLWILIKGTKGWFSIEKRIENTFGGMELDQRSGIKTKIAVHRIKPNADNRSIAIDLEIRSRNGYQRSPVFLNGPEAENLATILNLAASDAKNFGITNK